MPSESTSALPVPNPVSTGDDSTNGERSLTRILVVDDEKPIVRIVQINLERQGYEVVTAYDGKEALEKVDSEKPDLIIMDVMMPHMNGFEALKAIKGNPESKHIPVIMLTAEARDTDIFRGWQTGADCYLIKPFKPAELLGYVEKIAKSLQKG